MKKYQAGGGIREGKARFGDDVRERARKALEEQRLMKERGVEAMRVKPARPIKAKPLTSEKPKAKAAPAESKPAPAAAKPAPTPAPSKPAPSATKPTLGEAVSAGVRAMEEDKPKLKKQPGGMGILGMFVDEDEVKGKKKGGKVKKYAAGGSASKRADGCAMKGKTKGRMI